MADLCCICAIRFSAFPPSSIHKKLETSNEKAVPEHRLSCCDRIICRGCLKKTPRFASYCPYCQISTAPSNALPQGLRDPPPYDRPFADPTSSTPLDAPPPYTPTIIDQTPLSEKSLTLDSTPADDVLHFLDHDTDTIASLSLRYNVPIAALRRANGITADHLLLARRTVLIPGEFYKGSVSLSPRPVEGEEEEVKRGKIRRWMIACKVAEYEVAELYLKQAEYNLELAIDTYKDDERWEEEHPVEGSAKGKGRTKPDAGIRRFTGRRS